MMHCGPAGLKIIQDAETLELTAYLCPAGVWTIGWGHTGADVAPGMKISARRADELLRADVMIAEATIRKLVEVPLTQDQFDGLVPFVFNIGEPQFASSTMLRKLNAGNFAAAAQEFPRWNKARGKVLGGLITRRAKERALFEAS